MTAAPTFRWQTGTCPVDDHPDDREEEEKFRLPKGWEPVSGQEGVWVPAMQWGYNDLLWKRLLVSNRRPVAAPPLVDESQWDTLAAADLAYRNDHRAHVYREEDGSYRVRLPGYVPEPGRPSLEAKVLPTMAHAKDYAQFVRPFEVLEVPTPVAESTPSDDDIPF